MSKYKYEKEFMFSTHRPEEVELFLETEDIPLDLPAIRDNNKNTVIHHAAYHNQPKVLECYLKYYRKNLEQINYSISQIKLHTRYFLDQPNAEGYTAVHYAAYRGNLVIIKLLEKYQAYLYLTNNLKMTMLHLAAQGDKPATFLYLHSKKFDINQRDAKLSTPLHWASFVGSQKIVEYLLAQKDIELNPVDSEGFTPLHLATTYGNSKIVKKLLIAGADRQIKNKKGQTALQISHLKQFWGITHMLDTNYSCMDKIKIICNAKTKYQPSNKSQLYPCLFLFLSFVFFAIGFGTISLNNQLIMGIQGLFFAINIILFGSLVLKGKKSSSHTRNYEEFAQSNRIYQLCMTCIREQKPREHHCHICKVCIPQYDHHCTWINNCVGKHNIARFYTFLITLEAVLLWVSYLAIELLICLFKNQVSSDLFVLRQWIQSYSFIVYFFSFVELILALLFGLPLLCLIIVQTKNLLLGKTTYQRFSKSNQSVLTRQSNLLMNQQDSALRPTFRNCALMCCSEKSSKSQEGNSSTTTSFIR